MDNTLKKLFNELSKTNIRIDLLQRTVETFADDRQILEDVVGRLTALEEQQRLSRQNDNSVSKDIKSEIQIANDQIKAAVETQVESIKGFVETKRLKPKKRNFLQSILSRWRRR